METELINVYIIVNTVISYLMSSRGTVINNIILAIQFITTLSAATLLYVATESRIKLQAAFFIENKLP